VNWLAEIETPHYLPKRDWARPGRIDDFIGPYGDWHFDWCDVPGLIRAADAIYEYPMVDQDPLSRWTFGRLTLLGDAAHPMVPRGSNGAGQAILDARVLGDELTTRSDPAEALRAYEAVRLPATSQVVLTNRTMPPDAILREVKLRSGDLPFARIEDVISLAELAAMSERYQKVAGYDQATLAGRPSAG
jgi:2-polyprenyl-6-methoxyphenol hydroxylase-like FAD-dependent oxidoreductase